MKITIDGDDEDYVYCHFAETDNFPEEMRGYHFPEEMRGYHGNNTRCQLGDWAVRSCHMPELRTVAEHILFLPGISGLGNDTRRLKCSVGNWPVVHGILQLVCGLVNTGELQAYFERNTNVRRRTS